MEPVAFFSSRVKALRIMMLFFSGENYFTKKRLKQKMFTVIAQKQASVHVTEWTDTYKPQKSEHSMHVIVKLQWHRLVQHVLMGHRTTLILWNWDNSRSQSETTSTMCCESPLVRLFQHAPGVLRRLFKCSAQMDIGFLGGCGIGCFYLYRNEDCHFRQCLRSL